MSKKRVDLYVFIDGFGWELLKLYPEFLQGSLKTQHKTRSVLGYSNTCIPSILTGKQPDEHLQWASYYKAVGLSPFARVRHFSWLPSMLANNSRLRRFINQRLALENGFTGYFESYQIPFALLAQLAYTETQDIFQPMLFNGHPNVFQVWKDKAVNFEAFYIGSDETKSQALLSAINALPEMPAKLYLHLNKLDGVLHGHNRTSSNVRKCLLEAETQITQAMDALTEKGFEVSLHVFSDHGMCTTEKQFDLKNEITNHTGLELDPIGFSFFDATMARFWPKSPATRDTLTKALADCEYGEILSDERRDALHISKENLKAYGDLVFLANPGVVLTPNDLTTKAPYAMHGYDPQHKDSFGVYLSNTDRPDPPQSITEIFRHEFSDTCG